MEEEKKKSASNNQMDIFTKGYVKPALSEDEVEKIEIDDNSDDKSDDSKYNQNEEIINNPKTNEVQMKEKVTELIDELAKQDEIRTKKNKRKKSIKNIFLIIGIIIELIVIGFLCYIKFFKETYSKELTCTSTTQNNDSYSITMKNIYYFDDEDKVAKTENNIVYIFSNKEAYLKYKNEYVSSDIKDYKGITQRSTFDDQNYLYENKTIYTYSKLRKNKSVSFENNIITANIKGRDNAITIYIDDYDSVLVKNEETGFTCE